MSIWLALLAILPGIVLMVYTYRLDKIEREPVKLLLKLFVCGAISMFPAGIIEVICTGFLDIFLSSETFIYNVIEYFIIVGISEEICKFLVLKLCTWNHPEFDHKFDAIVYSVSASLGFAVLENIFYVSDGGLSIAIGRAVLSVPGHAVMGLFMGFYYGNAKEADNTDNKKKKNLFLFLSLLIPVLIHGMYDLCATVDFLWIVFLLFVIVLYSFAFVKIDAFAFYDMPLAKSKEAKALDAIIQKLEANMSNNYKDNAQENLKDLEKLYQEYYTYDRLSKKNIEHYETLILEYKDKMQGFTHRDQKPYWE